MSDDAWAGLFIGLTSTIWLVAVMWRTFISSSALPDRAHDLVLSRLAHPISRFSKAPVLPLTVFSLWVPTWWRCWDADNTSPRVTSWKLNRWPCDWGAGSRNGIYRRLIILSGIAILIPSSASLVIGDYTTFILNVAGYLVFAVDGVRHHPYNAAPHRYSEECLRIALATDHHEGTMYILPSKRGGMDATWSPKVASEHGSADREIMRLFRHMRSDRWHVGEPLERLRATMATYHEGALLSDEGVERLARWIYHDGYDPAMDQMSAIRCERAAGVHLIGRDLMYALCHAEYLVFMSQGRLAPTYQKKLPLLRLMRRSGAGKIPDDPDHCTIGFRPGYGGYKEAVEHVYAMFGYAYPEVTALNFHGTEPPAFSFALKKSPQSIEQYVSELWDLSTQNMESTFGALYLFTTVWFMELGNVNGFHIFPLRCRSRDGDAATQLLAWRQAWYTVCVAQLVSVCPALFAWFAFGQGN